MPESTCLHIQDQEAGPIRVVDIPWISVRIGRAAFCEVRLLSDDLADEACRLYRRGRSWHLVPAGSKAKILVAGRPVNASCLVPFDVPFRVGRHCLTIKQDRTIDPDWQMYPAPVPGRRQRSAPVVREVKFTLHRAQQTTAAGNSSPLSEGRLTSVDRVHKGVKEPELATDQAAGVSVKDRWETRWRAAGAELKARSARSAAKRETDRPPLATGFDQVPLKEAILPRPQPNGAPRDEKPASPRSPELNAATVESGSDSSGHDSMSSELDGNPIAAPEPQVIAGAPEPASQRAGRGVNVFTEPPVLLDEIMIQPAESQIVEARHETTAQFNTEANASAARAPWSEPPILETTARFDTDVTVSGIQVPWSEPVTVSKTTPFSPETKGPRDEAPRSEPTPWTEPPQTEMARPFRGAGERTFLETETAEPDRAKRAGGRNRKKAEGKQPAPAEARTDRPPRRLVKSESEPEPASKPPQIPSAKEILATHESRRTAPRTSSTPGRPKTVFAPTVAREPNQWALPAWVAGPPAVAFVMTVGLVSGVLSWWWTTDSSNASVMMDRLLAADQTGRRKALPESVAPPGGTWGRSTAQNLAHWAIFMSLAEPGEESSYEEVAALSSSSLAVSPLNPTARLAAAQLKQPATDKTVSSRVLGLSRDAASLSWCARRLLATGDKQAALEMYNKAFKVLTPGQSVRGTRPRFSEDPNVPRYLLPGEERVREVLRELLSINQWNVEEWSAAIPKDGPSMLATARLLKEDGRGEANAMLDSIVDAPQPLGATPAALAIALAARAEALALKSRWKESEQKYREAIDLIDDDTIKRSWWFNVADIDLRLEDEPQRRTAINAASAGSPGDEISRRTTQIQRTNNGRAPARPKSVRAN